jgi:hypothetical protein
LSFVPFHEESTCGPVTPWWHSDHWHLVCSSLLHSFIPAGLFHYLQLWELSVLVHPHDVDRCTTPCDERVWSAFEWETLGYQTWLFESNEERRNSNARAGDRMPVQHYWPTVTEPLIQELFLTFSYKPCVLN